MKYARDNRAQIVGEGGDLYLVGRSLGGAVAAYVATHPDTPHDLFTGVILESTFTSVADMVDALFYRPISMFKRTILEIDWKTIEAVENLTLPVLYITGDKDELVPTAMTQELYEASTSTPLK